MEIDEASSKPQSNVWTDNVILRYFIYVARLTRGQNLFRPFLCGTWKERRKRFSFFLYPLIEVDLENKEETFLEEDIYCFFFLPHSLIFLLYFGIKNSWKSSWEKSFDNRSILSIYPRQLDPSKSIC